jgi:hypothetical protein
MKKILASILVALVITATFILPVFASEVDITSTDIQVNAATCAVAPTLDGKINLDSFQQIPITADQCTYSASDDTELAFLQTLPFEAYMSYDSKNVYILLSGDASQYYYCDHVAGDEGNIWNESCCQMSFAAPDASGTDRLEIGLAKNSTDGSVLTNVWAWSPFDANSSFAVDSTNSAVLLDSGKLNYEVAIPWTAFLAAAPKVGDQFGLNLIYGWSNQGDRMFIEWSAGCALTKDASTFAKVTLTDTVLAAAPETTAAPDTQAPAAPDANAPVAPAPAAPSTPAPTTGDNTVVIFAVMAVAAAGVVIFRKKIFVK